jgi:glycosyltransferase involved in cell wall biosynthesis
MTSQTARMHLGGADEKIGLFLARLQPRKGLETLISAMTHLSGIRGDFRLVIAGS